MKCRVPLCTDTDGCAFALTTRYSAMVWSNVAFGGGHYPMTAILEHTPPPAVLGYTRDRTGKEIQYHTRQVCNTIYGSAGSGGNTDQYIISENMGNHNTLRIRKLTERECLRLMDVDDSYIDNILFAKDAKGKRLISKTQAYKLAGNSIVVNVLYEIFRKMFIDTEPTETHQPGLFD